MKLNLEEYSQDINEYGQSIQTEPKTPFSVRCLSCDAATLVRFVIVHGPFSAT